MLSKLLKIDKLARMYQLKNIVHIGIQSNVALIELESAKEILLEANNDFTWPLSQLINDALTDGGHLLNIKQLIRIELKFRQEYDVRQEIDIDTIANQLLLVDNVVRLVCLRL